MTKVLCNVILEVNRKSQFAMYRPQFTCEFETLPPITLDASDDVKVMSDIIKRACAERSYELQHWGQSRNNEFDLDITVRKIR